MIINRIRIRIRTIIRISKICYSLCDLIASSDSLCLDEAQPPVFLF